MLKTSKARLVPIRSER